MTETVLLQTLAVIRSAEAIQEQQAEPDSTERYVAGQDHEQSDGQTIALEGDADDGEERVVEGLRVVEYNIPEGCIGGYYPELNYLIPLEHHALESHVPAGKSVPVKVRVPA